MPDNDKFCDLGLGLYLKRQSAYSFSRLMFYHYVCFWSIRFKKSNGNLYCSNSDFDCDALKAMLGSKHITG